MRTLAPLPRALTASLLLGLLLRASPAGAVEDSPLKLVWTAPRHCPQQSELIPQIRKLVGSDKELERTDPLTARGVIETQGDQFHLTLLIQDGAITGTRSIASNSCRSLGDAAAVVLSLLIRQRRELGRALSGAELSGGQDATSSTLPNTEPSSDAGTNSSPPSVEPPRNTAATAPPNPPLAPAPPASPAATHNEVARAEQTKSWGWIVAAPIMHLEYGTLPKLSIGAGLALGVRHHHWQFLASAALFEPQPLRVVGNREFQARFLNRSAALWTCRTWGTRSIRLAPCAQLALNFVGASTSGDEGITSQSKTGTWLSVGAGVKASLHLSQIIGVFVRATGRLNLTRPDFLFVEEQAWSDPTTQRIHRISAGIGDFSLGCEWLF